MIIRRSALPSHRQVEGRLAGETPWQNCQPVQVVLDDGELAAVNVQEPQLDIFPSEGSHQVAQTDHVIHNTKLKIVQEGENISGT